MLEKYIDIPEYFENTKEKSVQLLYCELPQRNESEKLASDSLKELVPEKYLDGNYIVLKIIAMGAGEYYGDNSNADYFPEEQLKKTYKTFETNAKVYLYHKNKDPRNSYGDVIKAFYNDKMHRVELLIAIDKRKLPPNILDQLEKGENVPFSMGCRVAYDVCSICGNKARTRREYCTHGKLELGKIYKDGRKVYRINISPNFHDISIVRVPADKIAYPLQKVAEEIKETISKEDLEKNLNLENLLKYMAKVLGLSQEYVEQNKDRLIEEVKQAMLYLQEHPQDYTQALSFLGIDENSSEKNAGLLSTPIEMLALLTGALNLYILNKIMNQTKEPQFRMNYGNRLVIDRDASNNYFIASNTDIFERAQ